MMRHLEPLPTAPDKATEETGCNDREAVPHRPKPWWQRLWRRLPPSEAATIRLGQLNQQLAVLEEARTQLEAGWVQGAWWAVSSANGGRRLVGGLEVGLEAGPETGLKIGYTAPAATAPATATAPLAAAPAATALAATETASVTTAPAAAAANGKTGHVDGVCLVGALTRAAATGNGEGAGRAVDAVYDALWAARGQPATPATQPAAPAMQPATPATEPAAPAKGPVTQSVPPVPSPQVRLARVRTLTQWNDRPERTKAEVLTVVDHAISATILALATTPQPPATTPQPPAAAR